MFLLVITDNILELIIRHLSWDSGSPRNVKMKIYAQIHSADISEPQW